MPFRKNTTPRRLAGKNIPQKYINQFIAVFNSVYKKTKDEGAAYRQAYGVMNKSLYKDGYRKGRDGKWSKSHEALESLPDYSATMGQPITWTEELTLDKALREGFHFEGVALIDNSVSQLGTGWERYYSPEFNDRCMENTNKFMDLGHTVTMYNTHGSAMGSMFGASTKNPIGKVQGELWRDGPEIKYHGFISATAEGQDVIRLLFDTVMGESSVRMAEVQSILHSLSDGDADGDEEGEDYGYIEEMQSARLAGIDLCDHAGITGAGLVKILEESMTFALPELTSEEEDIVEIKWEELTLEELLENRKDLLDDHVATMLETVTVQQEATQAELDAAKVELETAQAKIVALKEAPETNEEDAARIASLELDLAIEQAAQIGVGREIAAALKEGVTTIEDIPKVLAAVREEAFMRALAGQNRPGIAKGQAAFEEDDAATEDSDTEEAQYTTEQLLLMHLA